jgi:hypothetical protein
MLPASGFCRSTNILFGQNLHTDKFVFGIEVDCPKPTLLGMQNQQCLQGPGPFSRMTCSDFKMPVLGAG